MDRPSTLGALRASGWTSKSVKAELRANLARKLRAGEEVFQGVVGYDRTVLPQVKNAILSRHDFILLGLRGQAKTRILRDLGKLLDDAIPVVAGSELREDPYHPLTEETRARIAAEGDDLPIEWIGREERYHEKLATPDVTIADLIGDVDPIKAASQRKALSDPGVIHYGLLPRSNRGILAINELPDLQARIQVGLLNILEEGDIQIRGFPLRLPLDVCLVFSANPEDYTNRGNIITPLRDRIASQVLTHYPRGVEESLAITRQEAWTERPEEGVRVRLPEALELAIEEVAFEARDSEFVDQASGVSARMTIALAENVFSSAEQRALALGQAESVVRPSDLYGAIAAISGKIELVYDGEREGLETVSRLLVGKALKKVFDARLPDAYATGSGDGDQGGPYGPILAWFGRGGRIDLAVDLSDEELSERLGEVPGLAEFAARELCDGNEKDVGQLVSAMEFVLEGLHQGSLLAKDELAGGRAYRDMLAEMADSLRD